tara:strand:- start:3516 stop:3860 length:345 start_codon:yes stop_codon:yes gene_type:complete
LARNVAGVAQVFGECRANGTFDDEGGQGMQVGHSHCRYFRHQAASTPSHRINFTLFSRPMADYVTLGMTKHRAWIAGEVESKHAELQQPILDVESLAATPAQFAPGFNSEGIKA